MIGEHLQSVRATATLSFVLRIIGWVVVLTIWAYLSQNFFGSYFTIRFEYQAYIIGKAFVV
jgi:hypothetical protein